MHEAFADRICGGMDRAVRELPFGPGMIVWTIDGYMFAAYTEAGEGVSLRISISDMIAGPGSWNGGWKSHMSGGWVLIPWRTRPEELRHRIAISYELVLADRNGHREEA